MGQMPGILLRVGEGSGREGAVRGEMVPREMQLVTVSMRGYRQYHTSRRALENTTKRQACTFRATGWSF